MPDCSQAEPKSTLGVSAGFVPPRRELEGWRGYCLTNVRKWNRFLTSNEHTGSKAMKTLPQTILEQSRQLPEGGMLAARDFLHLGSRAAVDQAFSRLAKAGLLIRVLRGLYVAPVTSRFGTRAPALEKVVQALAQKTQDVITDSGARAANGLGLTTQVPVMSVFLTRGRGRTLTLGKSKVEIRRVPKWMLSLGATRPGAVIGVWGAMEPKTNVSSESHRKGAFRSPAHPPGITL